MSFFTTIHIVTVEQLDQRLQSRVWYWDHDEATAVFESIVDQYEDTRIVTLYSIDAEDHINEWINTLMANRHSTVNQSPLEELRSNRAAPAAAVEFTKLAVSAADKDSLYTERTVSPDYWGYRVTKAFRNAWTVRSTDQERIGAVYLTNPEGLLPSYQYEWFKSGANEPVTAVFPSLQAAVEGLIERYHKQ